MTTQKITLDIQSHYQRIKQAEAEARYYYDHYLEHSQAKVKGQFNERLILKRCKMLMAGLSRLGMTGVGRLISRRLTRIYLLRCVLAV
jgi:hypothetical protein